ncbi:MAG: helix-turn-helix domain-containing protein [Halobacteria archaeon]|nr:helix-turn-helix domain-containing protein [Halobacteria archaeon]
MSLFQATFRLRHECPYRELSEGFPDLTIREWYLTDCQVLEITSSSTPTEDLIEKIEKLGTVLHKSVDGSGLHIVTQACLCSLEESIINRFEEHDCLYQPPTVHKQGWEHYTVIAFDEADIRSLYRDLENDREIEVLSKTGLSKTRVPHSMLAPVDQIFADLTDRQLEALRLALDNGYYQQPRECSASELAEHTTVARATFEEHLRKAENKLIRNAGQFVRLLSESRSDEGLVEKKKRSIAGEA